jgi:hypothetical protein
MPFTLVNNIVPGETYTFVISVTNEKGEAVQTEIAFVAN